MQENSANHSRKREIQPITKSTEEYKEGPHPNLFSMSHAVLIGKPYKMTLGKENSMQISFNNSEAIILSTMLVNVFKCI